MYFLLPFKGLSRAKTRWSKPGVQRRELVLKLLRQNLKTVSNVAGLDRVFLVSPDTASLELFATFQGFRVTGADLNSDLEEARRQLLNRNPEDALCVLLPDLPGLTEADVRVLTKCVETAAVALCPDEHDFGTNAIAMRRPESLDFLFEGASFERYQKACRNSDLKYEVLRSNGLAQDCDSIDDLERFCLL